MMVSVLMITYNHENYIRQAIEGILMQQSTFDFELVIANDNSPDNSHSIITDIINNHPLGGIIKYIDRSINVGMQKNFLDAYSNCVGKYIALCEGDDYWTDPLKLQKQVDFLETNLDYVVCFHDCSVVDENSKIKIKSYLTNFKLDYNENDLKKGGWLPTLTRCFRNVLDKYPDEFKNVNCGDLFLTSYLGFYGKAKFMDFNGANYREHSGGVWSGTNEKNRNRKMIQDFYTLYSFYENLSDNEISQFYKKNVYKSFILDIKYFGFCQSSFYNMKRFFLLYCSFILWKSINKLKLMF